MLPISVLMQYPSVTPFFELSQPPGAPGTSIRRAKIGFWSPAADVGKEQLAFPSGDDLDMEYVCLYPPVN